MLISSDSDSVSEIYMYLAPSLGFLTGAAMPRLRGAMMGRPRSLFGVGGDKTAVGQSVSGWVGAWAWRA